MANATVLVHRTMSLDGYIAGPDHDMDWIFEYPAPDDFEDIVRATGAILVGRGSYDVGSRDVGKPSSGPYGGAWSGPIFVLTHHPPEEPHDPAFTYLSGDIREAVATASAAADGKKLEVFGAEVATQCFEHGLVGEVLVHIAPVLLGDGVRFVGASAGRVDLELIGSTLTDSVTHLHFRVASSREEPDE